MTPLTNRSNYGPEASAVNALEQAQHCDLIVLLCSDLQDPPEIATSMVRTLLQRPEMDAVLAVKKRSAGGLLMQGRLKVSHKADCTALRGLLFLVGLLLSLVQARVAF